MKKEQQQDQNYNKIWFQDKTFFGKYIRDFVYKL